MSPPESRSPAPTMTPILAQTIKRIVGDIRWQADRPNADEPAELRAAADFIEAALAAPSLGAGTTPTLDEVRRLHREVIRLEVDGHVDGFATEADCQEAEAKFDAALIALAARSSAATPETATARAATSPQPLDDNTLRIVSDAAMDRARFVERYAADDTDRTVAQNIRTAAQAVRDYRAATPFAGSGAGMPLVDSVEAVLLLAMAAELEAQKTFEMSTTVEHQEKRNAQIRTMRRLAALASSSGASPDSRSHGVSPPSVTEAVTRFEVIDHRVIDPDEGPQGRVFSAMPCAVELSYQDGGKTLKVFVEDAASRRGASEGETR